MHATPNVVRPGVLSKGGDVMPRPTTSDRLCSPREVVSCHARCPSTVCAAQRQLYHATPDIVRPSVLSKGGDVVPRTTSFDCVCCPKDMMECHAQSRSTVCAVQRRRWHVTPNVVQPCLLSKGGDVMRRPTSFDSVCCPRAVMACHPRPRPTVCAVQRR